MIRCGGPYRHRVTGRLPIKNGHRVWRHPYCANDFT